MCNQDRLAQLVQDARRFIMYHKGAIEGYPLQTYASALLFSPTGSLMRQLFQHEEPEAISIRPAMSDGWSACLQTLEGHSNTVWSVAFSHDSTRLASASYDSTVKIWDASSGACLQTLEGHSGTVSSADLVSVLALPHSDKTVTKPQPSVRQEVMISFDNIWISDDAQELLWLPTEYRPVSSAISGKCVALGGGSGKFLICRVLLEQGPSSSMTTMDNRVGGTRRGGCNVLYFTLVL
jgi:WD40 repeat protein